MYNSKKHQPGMMYLEGRSGMMMRATGILGYVLEAASGQYETFVPSKNRKSHCVLYYITCVSYERAYSS